MFLLLSLFIQAQKRSISGYISDDHTGEALINATIINVKTNQGVLSNNYGFFSITTTSSDSLILNCSYVGYQPYRVGIKAQGDTIIFAKLKKGVTIEEVVVSSNYGSNYLSIPVTGIVEMEAALVEKLPTLLGEADLARMLQLMPGIQSGKEGTGGLYVRGGTNDQNLILLDGMPIYNANHIGGFISIFNPSSINYLKMYKAGFPARYGGRLSSILEVRMKDGNMNEMKRGYSIGTISGNFYFEGPIKKDTSSFIIAGRRTLFDLFTSAFNYLDTNGESNGGYSLWDLNAKYNKKLNGTSRVFLSYYSGRDKFFGSSNDTGTMDGETFKSSFSHRNSWGNTMASLRLNKLYSSKTFANYTVGFTNYLNKTVTKNKIKSDKNFSGEGYTKNQSAITTLVLSADIESVANNFHSFNMGVQSNLNIFSPSSNKSTTSLNEEILYDSLWGAEAIVLPEVSLYFSDQIQLTPKISFDLGLRWVNYFIEKELFPVIEPRITANYNINKLTALKFSYSRMSQFVHLVSTSDQAESSDFWFPSTSDISPEMSNQITLGGFWQFKGRNDFQLSCDLYYKTFDNLIELRDGASFIGSAINWEQQLIRGGKGYAIGGEFLLEKKRGRTTGWLAYTISKNMRKFTEINKNDWYPFRYDRRHELSLVVTHDFNKRINLSANWVYMSGEAVTLPQYKYLINVQQLDGVLFDTYSQAHFYNGKNKFRTPAYHRLDFSFNIKKEFSNRIRTWSIGLYNAYNSANPYYVYFSKDKQGAVKLYSYTLLPIMPSISYSVKF